MATRFDAENVLDMVRDIMSVGGALNAKITEIIADKATQGATLSPVLAPIVDYYEQTWNDAILLKTPSIFYGIENIITVDGGGPAAAKVYEIFVVVVMVDNGMTNDIAKRILRYARALEEVFQAAFDKAAEMGKVKIEQILPVPMRAQVDSSEEIKLGGVNLKVAIA